MRPYVLSIAGFDPSAGAGVLADIKVFESHKVYGLGVCSAITYQNDSEFLGLNWTNTEEITKQIEILYKKFNIEFIKIGIVNNLQTLQTIIDLIISKNKNAKIIWDPILKATAGFDFHKSINIKDLKNILNNVHLITPNIEEFEAIFKTSLDKFENIYNCNILIKGIENNNFVEDVLVTKKNNHCNFSGNKFESYSKHGTGCALSSSITANLALGLDLVKSCSNAKNYVEKLLLSNNSLLAYHNI